MSIGVVNGGRWQQQIKALSVSEHLAGHLVTMADVHRAGPYDRLVDGVERF